MTPSIHLFAPHPLPIFISSPGGPDHLMIGMAIFLVAFMLAVGLLYLRLHMLPDHIAHKSKKVQYEIVGVLGLLAMFTHINAFWIAGLLLALIDIPDFSTPLRRMSDALDRIASNRQSRMASRGMNGKPAGTGEIVLSRSPAMLVHESAHGTASSGAGNSASPPNITPSQVS